MRYENLYRNLLLGGNNIDGESLGSFDEFISKNIDKLIVKEVSRFFKKEFLLFVGPMFGGKTTRMLSELDRHSYRGRDIYVFKPSVDNRYRDSEIVSHNGGSVAAHVVRNAYEIETLLLKWGVDIAEDSPVIAIDELFMLSGASEVIPRLFRSGATLIASTIQLNSDGNPFQTIMGLMPYATKIEVCSAVCSVCSADAFYTQKIAGRSDFDIEVGGSDLYEPRCFAHFKYFGESL